MSAVWGQGGVDHGKIDPSGVTAIDRSLPKIAGLLTMALLFVAGGVFLVVTGAEASRLAPKAAIGWATIVFFGGCGVLIALQAIRGTRTVIVISPDGLQDKRLSNQVIEWDDIQAISTVRVQHQKLIQLVLSPRVTGSSVPVDQTAEGAIVPGGRMITPQGLKTGIDDLKNVIVTYWLVHNTSPSENGLDPIRERTGAS